MSKKMLVNATHHEENRVAIVEDGILTELDIEVAGHEPTKGNIYRAVVVRVESGLQAAFVDYGAGRLGFLQIDEINYKTVKPDYTPAEDGRRPRITDLLQRGQELLVQIIKEERGTKGAALTTYLSLAGRYMVIMPGSQTRGVSRKAESDSQRKELKQAMASLDLAENIGYIVRTAALNQTSEELERDYRYLLRLFESIKELNQKAKAPALIYKESNLIIRSIRDYFTTDMDEVLIDDPQVFKEAKDFFQMVMPDQAKLVKLHQERRPIFSRYQIEDQIETLSHNKIALPSGGSIVIDPTEALVAIDVNSGKMASEQGVEATATKTNIEAAREVGRQLRLRDLGGLVVIDFIDMRERKHAREVEKEVKKSLEHDKARVSVGRISQFGLLEMSRQRIKGVLAEGTYLTCPHCGGSGHLKSPETQAVALLRKIHASAAKGQVSRVDAQLPMEVATYLLNNRREELVEMERDHHLQIHIHGNRDFLADQVEIEITKKEKDQPAKPEFVSAGLLPIPAEVKDKQDNGHTSQKDSTETDDSGKKRRRRRRRKPSTTDDTQPTTQQTSDAPANDTENVSEASPETPPEIAAETKPQRPQRRRRTQSKKQEASVETEVTEAASVVDAENVSEASPETLPEVAAETKPQRPQRRRRTQSKKQETGIATEATEATEAASVVDAEPVPAVEQDKPSESDNNEQKPRRRQYRRKPKADSEESVKTSDASDKVIQEQPAETSDSTETVVKEQARPRRPRRSPRKPAQPDVTNNSQEKQVEPVATMEAVSPEPQKPVRRSRKKPAAKTDKPAQTVSTSDDTPQSIGANADVTEKPKRRRAPRKKEMPAEQVTKPVIQVSDESKPEEKQPIHQPNKKDTEAASEKTADEKPKQKRGRPRKKPVQVEPPVE